MDLSKMEQLVLALAVLGAEMNVAADDVSAWGAPSECLTSVHGAQWRKAKDLMSAAGVLPDEVDAFVSKMPDERAQLLLDEVGRRVHNPWDEQPGDDESEDVLMAAEDLPEWMVEQAELPASYLLGAQMITAPSRPSRW